MESVSKAIIHILLLLPLASITILSETTDSQCEGVSGKLHECAAPFLQSGNPPDEPPTECCNAMREIQRAESSIGVKNTCLCAKSCLQTHILAPEASIRTLDIADAQDIFTSLQVKCGVDLGFNISENAEC